MNKVELIGRSVKDCEVSKTNTGKNVAKFTIAVDRKFKNADGEREADFINIVAWSALADICGKYIKKGKQVAVCGEIQNRSFETQDGTKKYVTEIIASDIELLGSKTSEDKEKCEQIDIENGELPF